jgi:hypothetical protein|tara:strand:+ start:546 stop:719 length:174 start_codon:yes stop_codon:yes gene_type:complete
MLVLVQENIKWLGLASRYLEHQYDVTKDTWSSKLLLDSTQKDKGFEKEVDFIITHSL